MYFSVNHLIGAHEIMCWFNEIWSRMEPYRAIWISTQTARCDVNAPKTNFWHFSHILASSLSTYVQIRTRTHTHVHAAQLIHPKCVHNTQWVRFDCFPQHFCSSDDIAIESVRRAYNIEQLQHIPRARIRIGYSASRVFLPYLLFALPTNVINK